MKGRQTERLSDELAERRFARLYDETNAEILAYALRRAASPEDAADVVADTFLVAWRRLGEVPDGAGARLWLFGVARRALANQRRGTMRRERLAGEMREALRRRLAGLGDDPTGDRAQTMGALARLEEKDREVLLLAGWEELEPREIASVLGISAISARSRLHRARRRLRVALAAQEATGEKSPQGELRCEEAR
ncbi:MAG: sigma-70 family RNA polymerase sigma factor [Actinobacteria bacterium]|nr:sigma-70 family RNA polymerase sigma factor [Actinomycetota bacterium]